MDATDTDPGPTRRGSGDAHHLWDVFLRTASTYPDRPALIDDAGTLTYCELSDRVISMAAAFSARDLRAGDRIGLWLPRGRDFIACILAALRQGMAYVPCDAAFPSDRVQEIFHDAAVRLIVTAPHQISVWPAASAPAMTAAELLASAASDANPCADAGHEAYLIYTSGSTGKPKGVVLTQGQVLAFVQAEAEFFTELGPDHRVAQAFSPAFDASVEEIWLAFAHGATLVCVPADIARSPEEMANFLESHHVTIWSTVPTFLSAIHAPLPTLRLLILGGEACPDDLVRRHARPGLRMVNTYGPTETAVVATAEELTPGRSVRIGQPLPGYRAQVVDPHGQPLPAGQEGELWIGGPGVAKGYWQRPELTAEKFIFPSFDAGHRYYRSGDLVIADDDGGLRFRGRIDDQIKIRGHRVELGEIESRMMALPSIASAAVRVWSDAEGVDWLAAYVVADGVVSESEIRTALRQELPAYMVPARIITLPTLPTLPSGKIDRKQLPRPLVQAETTSAIPPDAPPALHHLDRLWHGYFPGAEITPESDFFDLGGHSLLAARMVSALRQMPEWSELSVGDVYRAPKLMDLAEKLSALAEKAPAATSTSTHRPPPGKRISRLRHAICGTAQALCLYPLLMAAAPSWLVAFAAYHLLVRRESEHQLTVLVLAGVALILGFAPLRMLLAVGAKWLLLGRVKPGRHPLWGWFHLRYWFVHSLVSMAESRSLRGSPWAIGWWRLMGARIGHGVHLETSFLPVPDLVSIGDHATIGHDAALLACAVHDGFFHLGPVHVGTRACIGARCQLAPDTRVADDAELGDGTLLASGQQVPTHECWEGSPARRAGPAGADWPATPGPAPSLTWVHRIGYLMGHVLLVAVPTLAVLPGALFLGWIDARYCDYSENFHDVWIIAAASVLSAASYVVVLALLIATIKWAIIGRAKPGCYPLNSWHGIDHWAVQALFSLGLETLFPFYATVYTSAWLRLLGARLGKGVEVSTAENMHPDLLDLDEGVFVADAVCLGASRVRNGWVHLDRVKVGRNSFLGNNGVTPAGTQLGADALVGVLSRAPRGSQALECDQSWLGMPPFALPRRQGSTDFGDARTRRPPPHLFLGRAFVEFWRIILPGALAAFAGFQMLMFMDELVTPPPETSTEIGTRDAETTAADLTEERADQTNTPTTMEPDASVDAAQAPWSYTRLILTLPLLLLTLGLLLMLATIALKWLIVGRHPRTSRHACPRQSAAWHAFHRVVLPFARRAVRSSHFLRHRLPY